MDEFYEKTKKRVLMMIEKIKTNYINEWIINDLHCHSKNMNDLRKKYFHIINNVLSDEREIERKCDWFLIIMTITKELFIIFNGISRPKNFDKETLFLLTGTAIVFEERFFVKNTEFVARKQENITHADFIKHSLRIFLSTFIQQNSDLWLQTIKSKTFDRDIFNHVGTFRLKILNCKYSARNPTFCGHYESGRCEECGIFLRDKYHAGTQICLECAHTPKVCLNNCFELDKFFEVKKKKKENHQQHKKRIEDFVYSMLLLMNNNGENNYDSHEYGFLGRCFSDIESCENDTSGNYEKYYIQGGCDVTSSLLEIAIQLDDVEMMYAISRNLDHINRRFLRVGNLYDLDSKIANEIIVEGMCCARGILDNSLWVIQGYHKKEILLRSNLNEEKWNSCSLDWSVTHRIFHSFGKTISTLSSYKNMEYQIRQICLSVSEILGSQNSHLKWDYSHPEFLGKIFYDLRLHRQFRVSWIRSVCFGYIIINMIYPSEHKEDSIQIGKRKQSLHLFNNNDDLDVLSIEAKVKTILKYYFGREIDTICGSPQTKRIRDYSFFNESKITENIVEFYRKISGVKKIKKSANFK